VVEISASVGTFRVVDDSPVRFIRAQGDAGVAGAGARGNLLALRQLLNLTDDGDWTLVLAWLVAALRPTGPYPILLVHGEQGTAKSMLVRILRKFVDPNKADLRAEPRDTRDLAIAAANGGSSRSTTFLTLNPGCPTRFAAIDWGGFATPSDPHGHRGNRHAGRF